MPYDWSLRLPVFYREIFTYYNETKDIIEIAKMNDHDFLQQPIFGNEAIKVKGHCLLYRNWIKGKLKYIKDLVKDDGTLIDIQDLYDKLEQKCTIMFELYTIKRILSHRLKECDLSLAKYINKPNNYIINGNKRYRISDQKSKFFYQLLKKPLCERNYMEPLLACEFKFINSNCVWKSIYTQKVIDVFDRKLSEFNFKILHSIVPSGYKLSKWEASVSPECQFCNKAETIDHMIFYCRRINNIWKTTGESLKIDIGLKVLKCGFIQRENSDKVKFLNMIFSKMLYTIFKCNSRSKFEKTDYGSVNVKNEVRLALCYYKGVLKDSRFGLFSEKIMNTVIECLT